MSKSADLVTNVELHLSCLDLPELDLMSKSDPFVVIYEKTNQILQINQGHGAQGTMSSNLTNVSWKEIFRTATVKNDSNPKFPDQIIVPYHFETLQSMRFEVYDRDAQTEDLQKHDFVGFVEVTLSKILGSRGQTYSEFLQNPKSRKKPGSHGKLIIQANEVSDCKDVIEFQFRAKKLERKNFFGLGKSDPFYIISQVREDSTLTKVFSSEVIKGTLNPVWKKMRIPVQRLNNGDYGKLIKVEVYDYENSGAHQIIGSFTCTVAELEKTPSFVLINEKRKLKHKDKDCKTGLFEIVHCVIEKRFSFLEYIRGGLQLNLVVAVDFTASNGHPSLPESLHHMSNAINITGSFSNVEFLNQYQKAILSVGRILLDYDSDKMVPMFGFGGKIQGQTQTDHCFPLTFNQNPEVYGLEGLMTAYKNAMNYVQLSGPTLFNNVIATANAMSNNCSQANQNYTILLILTDGVINDMDQTINQIVAGSDLPLSIIIVGVGNADFTDMETLDSDNELLKTSSGRVAKRDIVQFVPYNQITQRGFAALAEETLREVPEQVVSYFYQKNIKPNKPTDASQRHFVVEKVNGQADVNPLTQPTAPHKIPQHLRGNQGEKF